MPAHARPPAYAHLVLRIIDARTGEQVDAAPARRGLTRVEAHAPGSDTTNLRVLLVADLLVRALELGGTPVWALLSGERQQARAASGRRGARHPALRGRPGRECRAGRGPGRPRGREAGPAPDGARIAVAPAHSRGPGHAGRHRPRRPASRPARPATTRARARLDAAALDEARATLARWRGAVAAWARQPSRPMPDEVRDGGCATAWEDDLDVPGVLDVLRRRRDRAGAAGRRPLRDVRLRRPAPRPRTHPRPGVPVVIERAGAGPAAPPGRPAARQVRLARGRRRPRTPPRPARPPGRPRGRAGPRRGRLPAGPRPVLHRRTRPPDLGPGRRRVGHTPAGPPRPAPVRRRRLRPAGRRARGVRRGRRRCC